MRNSTSINCPVEGFPGKENQPRQPPAEFHAPALGGHHCVNKQGPWTAHSVREVRHVYTPLGYGRKTPRNRNVQDGDRAKEPPSSCHCRPGSIRDGFMGVVPGL